MRKNCSCDGMNENCVRCNGTGYYNPVYPQSREHREQAPVSITVGTRTDSPILKIIGVPKATIPKSLPPKETVVTAKTTPSEPQHCPVCGKRKIDWKNYGDDYYKKAKKRDDPKKSITVKAHWVRFPRVQ